MSTTSLTRRIRLFACANQVRTCQVISNFGFAKSGIREKYLVSRATWQIGFGPKRDWLSYARSQRGSVDSVHVATLRDWRKPKKAELFPDSHSSRTGNSNRQFHRRHSLLGTPHHINSLFPIGNPSVARSRIGFGFSGDARKRTQDARKRVHFVDRRCLSERAACARKMAAPRRWRGRTQRRVRVPRG